MAEQRRRARRGPLGSEMAALGGRAPRLLRAAAAAALALSLAAWPAVAADPTAPAPRTPIQHAVFLMGEAHSFDNLFGTYPGAAGIPAGACVPVDPDKAGSECVAPAWVGGQTVPDLAQSAVSFDAEFRDGKLNGFIKAQAALGTSAKLAVGYYDGRDVPFSWNIAGAYVLFDHFFSSARAGTTTNHLFWMAGTAGPAGDAIPPSGFGDIATIFDRLQQAGVSWKVYVQNYDPAVTFRNREGMATRASQVERVPLLAIARFVDEPALFDHIADLSKYYADLDAGTLPAVAYVVEAGGGAHTPGSVRASEQLGGSIINALTRSTAWPSSMLLWTYDGWGGWYDHVAPPKVDAEGYGFRVPALLVSPYARKGLVDQTQLDFASMVRFVTDNWGLRSLAARDAAAKTFTGAFDFASPPRPAVFVPATQVDTVTRAEPRRWIIFVAYGSALAFAVVLIGLAWLRSRRAPMPAPEAPLPPAPPPGPQWPEPVRPLPRWQDVERAAQDRVPKP